jgi:trigger factor
MDEGFFKGLGVEDEEHLRKGIRENLEQQKKQNVQTQHRRQIEQALQERSDFPVPESIHEQEANTFLQNLVNNFHRQGMGEEELEKNKEQLHAVAQESATNRIKLRYILLQHAEDKKIGVEDSEVQSVIVNEAMRQKVKVEDLVKDLRKDPSIVQGIRDDIVIDKALHDILHGIKGDECCEDHHHHDHDGDETAVED